MAHIHPTAIVYPSARLAGSVEVGPHCVVGPDVTIEARTQLLSHVVVERYATIGNDNVIHPFAVIGGPPQARAFRNYRTVCIIGDHNEIREHVTIHRGSSTEGTTRIGNRNLLMVGSHVAHDCIVEDHVTMSNQVMLAGHVRVETGATIGGGAGVHQHTTVGTYSFVAGLAGVRKDVPPFMIVEGNPAEVRGVNRHALDRNGFTAEHVEAIKQAHRTLFRQNGAPFSTKVDQLRRHFAGVPAVVKLCNALAASTTGQHGRALNAARAMQRYESQRT